MGSDQEVSGTDSDAVGSNSDKGSSSRFLSLETCSEQPPPPPTLSPRQVGMSERTILVLAVFQMISVLAVFKELNRAQICTETSTAPASA